VLGGCLVYVEDVDPVAGVCFVVIEQPPSNYWRAREVISAVNGRGVPGSGDLEEAYREYCQLSPATPP
jgi:hypothetical protein